MKTCRIVTDAGKAYIKPMGSPRGPHPLASELVGTELARWFGLPVADFAILNIEPDDEIPLHGDGLAQPGPAFASRALSEAIPWGGSSAELDRVENLDVIPHLVVFDTWTLNWDRHAPPESNRKPNSDNVLLTGENAAKGKLRMVAIDHTECFGIAGELTGRIAQIDRIQDERVFGVFPAFRTHLGRQEVERAAQRLSDVQDPIIRGFVDAIPADWQVSDEARSALVKLICGRAQYLAGRIADLIEPYSHSDWLFDDQGERT